MKEFLDKLFNIFPDFSPDWDMDEFSYIFFGDLIVSILVRNFVSEKSHKSIMLR